MGAGMRSHIKADYRRHDLPELAFFAFRGRYMSTVK